jgi:type III pantothenate kinase
MQCETDWSQAPQVTTNFVVDIGNTNIVLAIISTKTVLKHWRIPTEKKATETEIVHELKELFKDLAPLDSIEKIAYIGLATVVPSLKSVWSKAIRIVFDKAPFIVDVSSCNTFKVDYQVPNQIGADRICNVLACQALNMEEAIVIDLGTATTFDIYSQNTYWGGVICPGVLASLKDLSQKASLLSETGEVKLFWNKNIVGKTTDDALRNGILYGSVGQIEAIINQILLDLPMKEPHIVGTGGLSELIGEKTSMIQRFEKDLTLIGLNYFIYLQTRIAKKSKEIKHDSK